MLTINETSVNKKSNMKLILSVVGSTATIGVGAVYLFSNARTSSTGENLLNSIPKEISGTMKMKWLDPFNYYKYSMSGVFNKYEDENGEWSFSAKTDHFDGRLNRNFQTYIKDDRMYSATNKTIDCITQVNTIGYAQLKYDIMKGVEISDKDLESDVLERSKNICSSEHKKMVIETGDYGTLLICSKIINGQINGGVFGREWDLMFTTTEEEQKIEVPLDNKPGFYFFEEEEFGCKQTDKFETQKDFDEKEDIKLGHKQHKFIELEHFPFKKVRSLKRNKTQGSRPRPVNNQPGQANQTGKGGGDEPDNWHNCVWMHGAGNHKGSKKSNETTSHKKTNYYWSMTNSDLPYSNETRYFSSDTPESDMHGDNTSGMPNGSSNYYSFKIGSADPYVKESWYPFFIRGATGKLLITDNSINQANLTANVDASIHIARGILHEQCYYGKFWEANSGIRAYMNNDVKMEMRGFWCEGGWGCTVGAQNQNRGTILFTHSFGGLITMHALSIGLFVKGSKMVWGASQSPFRGSPGGNFATALCSQTGGTLPYSAGMIGNPIFDALWVEFRSLGYCRNTLNGSAYTEGLMIGSYNYEPTAIWQDDFTSDYRYCGKHPGGVNKGEYNTDWWQVDSVGDSIMSWIGWDGFNSSIWSNAADTMNNHETGNSEKLWILSFWGCKFFHFCDQSYCNTGGYDCSWRGCATDDCDHTNKLHWKNDKISFKGDGMVPVASCLGQAHTQFFDVDFGAWNENANDNQNIETLYTRFYYPELNTAADGIHHFKTNLDHPTPGAWTGRFFMSSGETYATVQQANHEDGIGLNGNGTAYNRAPLNWFTSVCVESNLAFDNNTSPSQLDLVGEKSYTFRKNDNTDVLTGMVDLSITGGYYVDNNPTLFGGNNHMIDLYSPADYFILEN